MSFKTDRMKLYLNQDVTWESKTGKDGYNKPVYASSEIKARKEKKRRMVRDTQGEEVVSETTLYTQSAIGLEDRIDSEEVINVSEWIDKDGSVIGYEVFL